MKKIRKTNKKGFTLTEMMLVIGIMVILATVITIAVATFLQTSRDAQSKVGSDVNTLKNNVTTRSSKLMQYGF